MRNVLPFVALLALGACAEPSRWEKPGVSDVTTVNDMKECRAAAAQESFSIYPYGYGAPIWGVHRGFGFHWMQWDSERFYAENRLTAFCMRNKGYELVPIAPPQARSPQAPPAPDR